MATSLVITAKQEYTGRYVGKSTDSDDPVDATSTIALLRTEAYGRSGSVGDVYVHHRVTLAAAPETIDLTGNANEIYDVFGLVVNLEKVLELSVFNRSVTSGEDLELGGNFLTALMGGATDGPLIPPKGELRWTSPVDGFVVTNTTQDTLTIDPGAATIEYDLIIIGKAA